MNTHLEIQIRNTFSLGFNTNNWPQAKHYVVNLGRRECRLIVPNNAPVNAKQIFTSLVMGIALSILSE